MRSFDYTALALDTARVPQELRDDLAACADTCTTTTVEPLGLKALTVSQVQLDGVGNTAAVLQINDVYGPEGIVVFIDTGEPQPHMAFAHYGRDARLSTATGNLVLTRSMYGPDDPEASPSGPPEISVYTWDGTRFMLQRRTGGGAAYAAYLLTDRVVT